MCSLKITYIPWNNSKENQIARVFYNIGWHEESATKTVFLLLINCQIYNIYIHKSLYTVSVSCIYLIILSHIYCLDMIWLLQLLQSSAACERLSQYLYLYINAHCKCFLPLIGITNKPACIKICNYYQYTLLWIWFIGIEWPPESS